MSTPCRRCSAITWFERNGSDVFRRCMCGLLDPICVITPDGIRIIHAAPQAEVKLPQKGTKLSHCLGAILNYHPDAVTTRTLIDDLDETMNQVTSKLFVLETKGIIERRHSGKGKAGGSSWEITAKAKPLLIFT